MTSKFTLRDFLVYFSSGAFLMTIVIITFYQALLQISIDIFQKYVFIKEFAGIIVILIIPLIYIFGHLLHGLGYLSLKIYTWIHRKLGDWSFRRFRLIEFIRKILHFFMYRNKVINAVVQENKENKTWSNAEEFWETCAVLQVKGSFEPANYWYSLNDLFKGLYTTLLFFGIISLCIELYVLGFVWIGLMLMCHFRAIQFATNFVLTVKRLNKAETTTTQQ